MASDDEADSTEVGLDAALEQTTLGGDRHRDDDIRAEMAREHEKVHEQIREERGRPMTDGGRTVVDFRERTETPSSSVEAVPGETWATCAVCGINGLADKATVLAADEVVCEQCDDELRAEEREDLYAEAQIAWGREAQLSKAAEEFSELAAAVNRLQNDQISAEALLEEMADARIMLEQLETDFTDEAVEDAYQEALDDLHERLPNTRGESDGE